MFIWRLTCARSMVKQRKKSGQEGTPVVNSIQAATMLADIMGKPPEVCLHLTRRLGEVGLIRRGSRGRSALDVNDREVATMTIALMAMTDGTTPAVQIPKLVERITKLDTGSDLLICLMGDDQTRVTSASFVEAMTNAIGGNDDVTGPAQAFGIQFCHGQIRAWAEWKEIPSRVYFGFRELPGGMVQEATINIDVLNALRQIPVKSPSAAMDGDGPKTTTPAQRQTGSASSVSSESPRRDCNRDAPMHRQNMHEHSREREKDQLDSGTDSPSPNRFLSGEIRNGCNSSHRCPSFAQS
jgi:hypothetical protein